MKPGRSKEVEKLDNAAIEHEQPMNDAKRRPRKRAPWWMYAIAAAFLICAAMRYYALYVQPENPGIGFQLVKNKSGLVPQSM